MATVAFTAFAIVVAVRWLSAGTSSVPIWLTITGAIVGMVLAVTGIASNVVAIDRAPRSARRTDLLSPVLLAEDPFVDRTGETEQLAHALVAARCVNLHAQRGAGKSHLLGFVADVTNGHRKPQDRRPPKGFNGALYFDMADTAGFEQFAEQICRSTYPRADSWSDFVASVDRTFGRQRVLLIMDNANLRSVWPPLGRAIYEYLARRAADCVVVGSVDPVVLYNLSPEYVPVKRFDLDAVRDLALREDPDLTDEQIAELYEQSGGLAVYLRLLLANQIDTERQTDAVEGFLQFQVLPDLDRGSRSVVAAVALLATVDRSIDLDRLTSVGLADLDRRLVAASQRSLLHVSPDGRVRMHDLVRDGLVRLLPDEIDAAAAQIVPALVRDGQVVQASLAALHGDPDQIELDLAALHATVIDESISRRNYPVLETIAQGYSSSERLARFAGRKASRRARVLLARATALAGAGDYAETERVLLDFAPLARSDQGIPSGLAFDLRFLLADSVHLLNRYDEALEMFGELRSECEADGDRRGLARCRWAIGHSVRHQGIELDRALADLEAAAAGAREAGDLAVEVLATADAVAVLVAQGRADDGVDGRLAELEAKVRADGHRPADLVKLRKEQARVNWALGRTSAAVHLLDEAIDDAMALNDRLLYNLYFERADLARIAGQVQLARTNYQRVAAFSAGNQDRNMIANAMIGLALCDALDDGASPPQRVAARAALLRAEDVARGATLYGTASLARELVGLVDGSRIDALQAVRVIVF